MINFRDYSTVRLCTHGRTESATGHKVGHFDDFACRVVAGMQGWYSERLSDLSPTSVSAWLSRDPSTLNIVCDFIYVPGPELTNVVVFDHHDPDRPTDQCSVHQLVREMVRQGLMRDVPGLIHEISHWDVLGPNSIPAENRPDQDRYFSVLAAEPVEGFDRETAEFIWQTLEKSSSLRQLIDELFYSQTSFGQAARRIHEEIQIKREEALAEITRTAAVSESPSGVRYATLDKNPAGLLREIFSRLGVDIVVHPNERTPNALSVVRDSNGKYASTPVADLVEVAQEQVAFTHPGGFLLVAYPPVHIK
jgi:hypothetical protein